jgi:type II secretory ATPase GspE/PulE/Tfp pilus assembly ATPase PilB-like protein
MPHKELKSILEEKFGVSPRQWQECLEEHKRSFQSLVHILIDRQVIKEEDLLGVIASRLNLPLLRIKPDDVDQDVVKTVPIKLVTHYNFMPLRMEGTSLLIAVSDPLDLMTIDDIRMFLAQDIALVVSARAEIQEAIRTYYGLGAQTLDAIAQERQPEAMEVLKQENKNIQDQDIDPSVIKFLNQVLMDAIKQGATDIHFEPFEDDLRIRYRIDGILYGVQCPPTIKQFQSSIASRIKVMANLDIAERRRPQDGRIDVRLEKDVYDLRVSVMPTPFGESIGIRILPRSSPVFGLEKLGLESQDQGQIDAMIRKPHGIILVTGPTGSGKTTTLYACLNTINSAQRKILTIEDPIEYQLKGITQMQAEPKIGFSFANALRFMLRHDPDVMMVGEIRDSETAELAVRTALTGHLVFSTLHTNNAAGAITRLLDMGVDSFLVSSSVNVIIAQRLVRTICPACKHPVEPSDAMLKQFGAAPLSGTWYAGKGCEACRFTGYKGRSGIFEIVQMTDEIRDMTLKKLPSHQIMESAVAAGTRTLKQAGLARALEGLTTLDEILRVTHEGDLTAGS